ncbi:MAG: methionine biosynthesis protein MetW [Chloroflexi bacterium]|nr:methionine biosynthesis protein MetW [Chloroflexota bacterium]
MENNGHKQNDLRADLLAVADLIEAGEKVLDLGCGDGALLRYLMDSRQITGRGVELSEAGVLACVRKGVSVRQGDLHEGLGDYPNQSFDTVILSYTIPYLNEPAFVLKEMLRVGARAVVSFPNWGHWRCRLDFLQNGRSPMAPGLPQPWNSTPRIRPLTVRDFLEFCGENQIRVTREIYLDGNQRHQPGFAKNLLATTAIFELR